MKAARPDLSIIGIDWRGTLRPAAQLVLKGDVLRQDFGVASFDAIVLVSALEHIGLGHYDADPLYEHGDFACVSRAKQWLKPGGLLYFDVPWNPDPGFEVMGTECRVYDDLSLRDRLRGDQWIERFRGWTTASETSTLLPARPTTKNGRFYYVACVWEKP